MPSVKREANKPFYTALIKIEDLDKAQLVAKALRYFTLDGKPCRALPFLRELLEK